MALFCLFVFQLKLSFTLDKETMMPQGCYVYQYRDSNKWVATTPKSNVWGKKNPWDTKGWDKNAVNLHCFTTSHCFQGWWRSSCCWLTSPQHTTSMGNSLSWLCSGATLHPKPKWWMSCRSCATSWESTSICPQQELCMSVDRLLNKSPFCLICWYLRAYFKWLKKENGKFFFYFAFPTCRRVSLPLSVMTSTPQPGKRFSPTCVPGQCRLELSLDCWSLQLWLLWNTSIYVNWRIKHVCIVFCAFYIVS